jgi:hypothetical protein
MASNTEYDLTQAHSKFLDKHLVFPLLEFASQKQLYATADIEAAKLDLIGKTNMVDYAVDIYQQLHQTTDVSIYLLDFKFLDVNSNSQWYGHVYSHSL